MNLSTPELSLIDSYLGAVGERLAESDRDETLAEIKSHIHEAIAAHALRAGRERVWSRPSLPRWIRRNTTKRMRLCPMREF